MIHKVPTGRAVFVITVILLLTAVTALPVGAQDAPVIQQAELRLWPEYDDPGLLVIFSGSFEPKTTFPMQVAFPIPAGARNVQATFINESGTLISRPFEIEDGRLTYELPSANFHIEFYLDRALSGDQRTISYTMAAPYAIQALTISVQQPARSTGFALTPAADSSEQGADGLTYHILNRQDVAAGERLDLVLSYSKPDTGLTAPQLAVTTPDAPAQSETSRPAAATGSTNLLPWFLIGLGAVLLAASLTYWFLSQRRRAGPSFSASGQTPDAGAKTPPAVRPGTSRTAAAGDVAAYCTNCGNQLRADDRFCSQCGSPRRS